MKALSLNATSWTRACFTNMLGSVRPNFAPIHADAITLGLGELGYQDKKSENRIAGRYRRMDLT